MSPEIQINAVAARTPVGLALEPSAAAVRAGIKRLREHPLLLDASCAPVVLGLDGLLDPALYGAPRMLELGRSCLEQLIRKLPAEVLARQSRIPLFVGLPEIRPGFSESDGRWLCAQLSQGPAIAVFANAEPLFLGHAASLEALRQACEHLSKGGTELCVVGGIDSYVQPETLAWLDENRQLSSAKNRSGFVPGEAAGFALVSTRWASQCLGRPLARVRAVHCARETKLIKRDVVCLGDGLCEAVSSVLGAACPSRPAIQTVYCDINGERYRSEEWGFVSLRLPCACADPASYEAPANCWGDVGAASGILFIGLAGQGWRRGYANGQEALLWASSEAGLRSAALLESVDHSY